MATIAVEITAIAPLSVKGSLFTHIINYERCEWCGICAAVCPFDCIVMHHLVPYFVAHRMPHCISCGACRSACPREAITRRVNP
jgi:Pyruvate/2-oxoacid:ferredoxin oxidoreductase delta subunit